MIRTRYLVETFVKRTSGDQIGEDIIRSSREFTRKTDAQNYKRNVITPDRIRLHIHRHDSDPSGKDNKPCSIE